VCFSTPFSLKSDLTTAQNFVWPHSALCPCALHIQADKKMPGITTLDDDAFDEQELIEEEQNSPPTFAQNMVLKLQDAAAWYSDNIHPHITKVREPLGYIIWCVATAGVIAGLPTAKAIFSDPYTELSMVLQAQEQERNTPPPRARKQ